MNDVTVQDGKIWIEFPYSEGLVASVKRIAGARWDADVRKWYLPARPLYAALAKEFAIKYGFMIDHNIIQLTEKPKVNILDRSKLYEHQPAAVDFIHATNGNCILADDMGVGKTLEALWYAKEAGLKTILIVAPASVVYKWKNEVSTWLEREAEVVQSVAKGVPNSDILIVSYDLLWRLANVFEERKFDLAIADESHMIKSKDAKRSEAFRRIHSDKKLFLSGTPFLNRPKELFNILNMIDPGEWSSWYAYASRYCDGHHEYFGSKKVFIANGSSNEEELKTRVSSLMIRRTKGEVAKYLPELTRIVVPVDITNKVEYNRARKDLKAWLLEHGKDGLVTALTKLTHLRMLVGSGKVKSAVELALRALDSNPQRKVVLYAHHRDVVKALFPEFKDYGVQTIRGEDSQAERARTIEQFQNKINPRVLIITSAGGMGIDLYRADTIIFVEREWSASLEEQIESRLHRSGQKSAVTAYYLVARDTIDEYISWLVEHKRDIFDKIIGSDQIEQQILDEIRKEE